MKAKTLIIVAAVAMLATGCRDIRRQMNDLLVYPTTAGEVAAMAKDYHSDAALVVTKADTQYVLYRHEGGEHCYAMRYVSQHRCRHDFSARGGNFSLDEPEQSVVLTRTADNALAFIVDSVEIAVADIAVTDSETTFSFGFDEPDREAVLYLYGKARDTKDIFAETSIQQMLSLALSMDALMADWEDDIDSGFVETGTALEEASYALEAAELELDAAMATLDSAAGIISNLEFYAEYRYLDSLACALGFTEKKSVAHGDGHLKYTVSGGKGGSKACYARMETMHDAAAGMHRRCTVEHSQRHRKCRFTVEW